MPDPVPHAASSPGIMERRETEEVSRALKSLRTNGPLALGRWIVLFIVALAAFGPFLAPRDPMEVNQVIRVGERWIGPPFAPLTAPGFPLGSDRFGRDLLSQLMWAVRPTMVMVTVVAAVRLTVGTGIGLISGWYTGRASRVLGTAISGALSVPVLIVALAAITAVGVERGLVAFILGLSLTGWAETAQIVREQTRLIKTQPYIEAARALGGSGPRILFRHVLRQIMPMVWMLLAFEISNTLVVVAGLGFLGHYIGGGAWVEVTDFVATNVLQLPELGQLLAESYDTLLARPWGMIFTGTVIFIAVLGFNLLGEGLRLQLSPERMHRPGVLSAVASRAGAWVDDAVLPPVLAWAEANARRFAIAGALVLAGVGGVWGWQTLRAATPPPTDNGGAPGRDSGGPRWATQRGAPQGSLWSGAPGPKAAQAEWVWNDPAGFAGGPAISADGTAHIATLGGQLVALDPSGVVLWQTPLPETPVGTPALGPDGVVYVADKKLGVSAFSPAGEFRWRFESSHRYETTAGPIVAPDGTVYYSLEDSVQAVTPNGEGLWWGHLPYTVYVYAPPRLSPDGNVVFLKDGAFDARDGRPLDSSGVAPLEAHFTDPTFLVGADGETYFLYDHSVVHWTNTDSGMKATGAVGWDARGRMPYFPADAGVTPDGTAWLFYSTAFSASRLVWIDEGGRIAGDAVIQHRDGRVIGLAEDSTLYTCGLKRDATPQCLGFAPGSDQPAWKFTLEEGQGIAGGALISGRLYVATSDGYLYALGD